MSSETVVTSPEYLTMRDAAKVCPSRTPESAVYRWSMKGVMAESGERIRLQHIRVGRKMLTTREWVFAFFRELADANVAHAEERDAERQADRLTVAASKAAPATTVSGSAPSAAAQRAMAALAADGI